MTDDLETRDFNAITRGRTVLTTWFRFVLSTATGEQSEPSKPESPAVRMLGTSRELVLLGYHGPAMVTAQTLSDTYFGEVMASLFHHHQMEHVHCYSLGRAEHIAIYQSLAEDPLRQARFWEGYKAGRKRRDAWAHGISQCSGSCGCRLPAPRTLPISMIVSTQLTATATRQLVVRQSGLAAYWSRRTPMVTGIAAASETTIWTPIR
jgi:hypothetical protein